ncbi:MAG: ice-binding family protein [Saprospiraceae bacterium]|nr:ice-binding family protein [Saprospiraceae bacterium]
MIKDVLLIIALTIASISIPNTTFAQAPDLGTAAGFVLFSTDGAVSHTGISQITGNVGTNNGSSTGFGNVNGVMHDGDPESAQCASDLLIAYNQLDGATPTFFPAPLLGNGQTLVPGVYSIGSAATLNLDLNLDAQGNSEAVFIIQIDGSLSTNADANVNLLNAAQACNVFWKVEGLISMASGTTMRGTLVANNAAIVLGTGNTLEGRALTTTGAITVDGVLAYTPIGCGSPYLTGPEAPHLGSVTCYSIFSSNGAVTNTGVSHAVGDIGSNDGSTTGYDPLLVEGTIHPIPDGSTQKCAQDLLVAYDDLNLLTPDIELLFPAQFGNDLVLTPHTYIMQGAATLTGTVTLNAQGNSDAVFVIQINGALTTSTYANVELMNGTLPENVFWKIEGAVNVNDYSNFRGTIICNNGALGALSSNVTVTGRLLSTNGAITTAAMDCNAPGIPAQCKPSAITPIVKGTSGQAFSFFPNPIGSTTTVVKNDPSNQEIYQFKLYDLLGALMINTIVTGTSTELQTNLAPGVYFYQVIGHDTIIQSGKLISE